MIDRGRCRVRSAATARRCTLRTGHPSDHERRSRSGRLLEQWPRSPNDPDFQTATTSAELIAHLDDLINLAKWEGFGVIVGELSRARQAIVGVINRKGRRRRARPDDLFGWSRGPRRDPPRT